MRVRMTTSRAGPGFVQREGEVHDLPSAEARRLIKAGQAERVKRKPETAMKAGGAENAMKRGRGAPRGRAGPGD